MTREEARAECERLQSQPGQASASVWMTSWAARGAGGRGLMKMVMMRGSPATPIFPWCA